MGRCGLGSIAGLRDLKKAGDWPELCKKSLFGCLFLQVLGFTRDTSASKLYNELLWRKEIERFLLGFGWFPAQAISGNCFVNSLNFLKMKKSLVLAAVIAAAALAACGKKEEAAPAAAPAAAAAAPAADAAAAPAAAPAASEAAK